MQKINLAEKLGLFHEYWSPRIVAELNGQHVKLAKIKGEFVWHNHATEDELFLVLKGRLVIKLREGNVVLEAGELCVVPRGMDHCPCAEEEVHIMLFEPVSTAHTGNVKSDRTVEKQDWI